MPRIALVGVIVVAMLCTAVGAAATTRPATTRPTTTPTTRAARPVPTAGEQAAMEKIVRELFRAEYARKAPAERRALAGKLLQQGRETRDNVAARYVLWREARDLAVLAGDVALAGQAVGELAGEFAVDALAMRLSTFQGLEAVVTAPPGLEALATHCLEMIDQAVVAGNYDTAGRLLSLADGAAERSQKVALSARVHEAERELAALRQEDEQCLTARAALRRTPENADAKLLVGRVCCFVRNDWEAGLPLLARSADPALRALAQKDLAAGDGPISEPVVHLALGNGWWDVAQAQPRLAKLHVEARAAYWYRRALPLLTGMDRQVAAARAGSTAADPALAARLRPGLVAEVFSGAKFDVMVRTRIDEQVNFDWGEAAPGESLPKDDFSFRWTGWLKVTRGGKYTFVVQANSGARLAVDGAVLVDEDRIYRHRTGVKAAADLAEGLHAIRLEFWDTSGAAKMVLQWLPPGAKEPLPIPPEAFGHEETPELAAELNRGKK